MTFACLDLVFSHALPRSIEDGTYQNWDFYLSNYQISLNFAYHAHTITLAGKMAFFKNQTFEAFWGRFNNEKNHCFVCYAVKSNYNISRI